jgi:hypothetical protein
MMMKSLLATAAMLVLLAGAPSGAIQSGAPSPAPGGFDALARYRLTLRPQSQRRP